MAKGGTKTFARVINPNAKTYEVYNDFSGGLNTEKSDSETSANQFRKLINFDIDEGGSIKKRPGLYRIPGVQKSINKFLTRLVTEGKIDTLTTMQVQDCINFYDGAHWVFNYITNKGVVVLLLDRNMRIPSDLNANEGKEEFLLFYSNTNDNTIANDESNKYKTKISSYDDKFIMVQTFYAKPNLTGDITESNEKQVRIFSWNPVKKDDVFAAAGDQHWRPGWIEASDDKHDLKEVSHFGNSSIQAISSKPLDIDSLEPAKLVLIDIKPIDKTMYDNDEYWKVEYEAQVNYAALRVWNSKDTNRSRLITLYHQNGESILDEAIFQIVYWDKYTIRVYLKDHVRFNSYWIREKIGISNFKKDNKVLSLFKFIDIDIKSGSIKYPTCPNQLNYTYDISMAENSTLSVDAVYYSIDVNSNDKRYKNIKYFSNLGFPYQIGPTTTDPNLSSLYSAAKSVSECTTSQWVPGVNYHNNKPPYQVLSDIYIDLNRTNFYSGRYEHVPAPPLRPEERPDSDQSGKTEYYYSNRFYLRSVYPLINEMTYQVIRNNIKTGNDISCVWWRITNVTIDDEKRVSNGAFSPGTYYSRSDYAVANYESFEEGIKNVRVDNDRIKKFFFGSSTVSVRYTLNGNPDGKEIRLAQIDYNTFKFETLTPSNLGTMLMEQHDINLNNAWHLFGNQLFQVNYPSRLDDETDEHYLERCKQTVQYFEKEFNRGVVTNTRFVVTYETTDKFGQKQVHTIPTKLEEFKIGEFLEAIKGTTKPRFVWDYLNLENNIVYANLSWIDSSGQTQLLVSLNKDNPYINNWDEIKTSLLSTLKLNIVYEYLPNGYIDRVLNFKQLPYLKPNLNDLSYLWYNLATMSSLSKRRYPNIYDEDIHKNITNVLVEYPTAKVNENSGRMIELFGIYPVNNLILRPGRQKFQLFYRAQNLDVFLADGNFKIAITGMSIKDYNQMINSPDYSTTGEGGKKSPNWKNITEVLVDKDMDPNVEGGKPAIFEWDVPDTTQPYLLLVQIASSDEKKKINVATLVETRLEMQPSITYSERLDIMSMYDQFTTTTQLFNYKSNLVAYGSSNRLFFSDISLPSYYPLSQVLQLKTPEAIRHICIFQNKLIVSTENSRFYVGGSAFDNPNDPFYIANISSDCGLLAPKSEVPLQEYLYFLDTSGIKILKNLYGTADKEYTYAPLDDLITSLVPKDRDACACAFNDKYYICFPQQKWMLIYNTKYKAWTSYQSDFFNFTSMFVNDGKLYGVDALNYNIYEFDDDVYVDSWNEEEDGYIEAIADDGSKTWIQKGQQPITCYIETKGLDQSYVPQQKKYENALIEANIYNDDVNSPGHRFYYWWNDNNMTNETNSTPMGAAPTSTITPLIKVDNNIINYKFDTYLDNNRTYNFKVEGSLDQFTIFDKGRVGNLVLGKSKLGDNHESSFYYLPIRRSGFNVTFGLKMESASGLKIKSLEVQYALRNPKVVRNHLKGR